MSKIKERPEFTQIILYRSASEKETVAAVESTHSFGNLCGRILDAMRLIENDIVVCEGSYVNLGIDRGEPGGWFSLMVVLVGGDVLDSADKHVIGSE